MYFIVDAPYEQCFALFFKDELGYPNFYRLSELFPTQGESFKQLVLLAPDPSQTKFFDKISAYATNAGLKFWAFGEHALATSFTFSPTGSLEVDPLFKDALHQALNHFLSQEKKVS